MDRLRIAEWVGIGLAGLGGALFVLSFLNGGSAPVWIAGATCAVVGWSIRLWAKAVKERPPS